MHGAGGQRKGTGETEAGGWVSLGVAAASHPSPFPGPVAAGRCSKPQVRVSAMLTSHQRTPCVLCVFVCGRREEKALFGEVKSMVIVGKAAARRWSLRRDCSCCLLALLESVVFKWMPKVAFSGHKTEVFSSRSHPHGRTNVVLPFAVVFAHPSCAGSMPLIPPHLCCSAAPLLWPGSISARPRLCVFKQRQRCPGTPGVSPWVQSAGGSWCLEPALP